MCDLPRQPGTLPASHGPLTETPRDRTEIALLVGSRDGPVDAVRGNSWRLAEHLRQKGRPTTLVEVNWDDEGVRGSLRSLREELEAKSPGWVVLHYVALGWGPRGLPFVAPLAVRAAKRSGARFALDLHEPGPAGGTRLRDRVRAWLQLKILRWLERQADAVLVHIPAEVGSPWLSSTASPLLLPSGSNIDRTAKEPVAGKAARPAGPPPPFTVLVFCLTDSAEASEGPRLAELMRRARPNLPERTHLRVIGRGAEWARPALESGLSASGIDLEVRGLIPEEEVSAAFESADVLLSVRHGITSYRSSAITALQFGLPIVAYESRETHPPITDAGVLLVPYDDIEAAADALVRIARDPVLRASLVAKSTASWEQTFSWDRIAEVAAAALPPARS